MGWGALLVLALATLPLPVWAAGMAFGPPLFLVQHLPPGKEVDLEKAAGVVFTVYNRSKEPLACRVGCLRPGAAGMSSWETGYEEIPDPGWARLDRTELTVPPESQEKVRLFFHIPDRPEHYNRRWMLGVVAAPGNGPKAGVGLALAARVQMETLPAPAEPPVQPAGADGKGGALRAVPGLLLLDEVPAGGRRSSTFLLRNDTGHSLHLTVRRIRELFASERMEDAEQKRHRLERPLRYFGSGVAPLLDESWTRAGELGSLAPGESRSVTLETAVPASAVAGRCYEELLFFDGGAELWPEDLPAWREFAVAVSEGRTKAQMGGPAQRLWDLLEDPVRESLRVGGGGEAPPAAVAALNALLCRRDFHTEEAFGSAPLAGEALQLLGRPREGLSLEEVKRLNRLLLEGSFPRLLADRLAAGGTRRVAFVRVRITVAGKDGAK